MQAARDPSMSLMAWLSGLGLALMLLFVAGPAAAQCCAPPTPPNPCNCNPPPCCTPPTPPPPPTTNCCTPSHNVTVPGVNVFVSGSVNVQVKAQASASASAGGTVFVGGGGGGGGGYVGPGASGVIQGLDVQGAQRTRRVAYQAQRSRYLKIVVQAFCLDDRDVPHPASQVTPDHDIDDAYDGELYRCIAGTRMQYTWVEYHGQTDFSGGHTIVCAKGEALYHTPGLAGGANGQGGAQMVCRPQKPARDCNERSLLRRYGAGLKVLSILIVETYTAYREERFEEKSSSMSTMSLDGGVGGIVY